MSDFYVSEKYLIQCYTDGASRGNPGPSAYAFLLVRDGAVILQDAGYLGKTTNNCAEYQAIIHALQSASGMTSGPVEVYSDSELVVRQINGEYRVRKRHLAPLYQEVKSISGRFASVAFSSVPRTHPFIRQADLLCNRILDEIGQAGSSTIAGTG